VVVDAGSVTHLQAKRLKECVAPGCQRRPSFGQARASASRCSQHKIPGDVDVVNLMCKRVGCSRAAIFGGPDTAWTRSFCKRHCGPSHLNLAYLSHWNLTTAALRNSSRAVTEMPFPLVFRRLQGHEDKGKVPVPHLFSSSRVAYQGSDLNPCVLLGSAAQADQAVSMEGWWGQDGVWMAPLQHEAASALGTPRPKPRGLSRTYCPEAASALGTLSPKPRFSLSGAPTWSLTAVQGAAIGAGVRWEMEGGWPPCAAAEEDKEEALRWQPPPSPGAMAGMPCDPEAFHELNAREQQTLPGQGLGLAQLRLPFLSLEAPEVGVRGKDGASDLGQEKTGAPAEDEDTDLRVSRLAPALVSPEPQAASPSNGAGPLLVAPQPSIAVSAPHGNAGMQAAVDRALLEASGRGAQPAASGDSVEPGLSGGPGESGGGADAGPTQETAEGKRDSGVGHWNETKWEGGCVGTRGKDGREACVGAVACGTWSGADPAGADERMDCVQGALKVNRKAEFVGPGGSRLERRMGGAAAAVMRATRAPVAVHAPGGRGASCLRHKLLQRPLQARQGDEVEAGKEDHGLGAGNVRAFNSSQPPVCCKCGVQRAAWGYEVCFVAMRGREVCLLRCLVLFSLRTRSVSILVLVLFSLALLWTGCAWLKPLNPQPSTSSA
jgi:hypothetical protein